MNGRTRPVAGAPRPALAADPRIPLLDCDHVPGHATGRTAPGSLLLLHGFAEDKTALRPLGAALCPRGSTAVHPTLRGHGASPRPAWGYSPLDFAADLHRIADTFPRPLHVIGYSFGALIAAVTAVALGPSRIASVAVLDQSFEAVPERYEEGPWAEASHLKWNFDHTHYLDMLCAAEIPVLSVLARASPVVPEPEKKRMSDRRGEFFSCTVAEGDHRSFLRESAIASLADFYGRHFPVTTFTEAIS